MFTVSLRRFLCFLCGEILPHCSTLCAVHENKCNLILFINVGIAMHKRKMSEEMVGRGW